MTKEVKSVVTLSQCYFDFRTRTVTLPHPSALLQVYYKGYFSRAEDHARHRQIIDSIRRLIIDYKGDDACEDEVMTMLLVLVLLFNTRGLGRRSAGGGGWLAGRFVGSS